MSLESPSDRNTAVWAPRDGAAADDGPSLHHPRNTVRILHSQTQAFLEAILHLLVSADEDDVSKERCQLSETFLNWAEGRVREPYLNPSGGFRASAVCLISTISEAWRGERPSTLVFKNWERSPRLSERLTEFQTLHCLGMALGPIWTSLSPPPASAVWERAHGRADSRFGPVRVTEVPERWRK